MAGAAAATRLVASGWEVRVHEKAAGPWRPGKGFLLLENGVAAARRLGAWDAVAPLGHRLEGATLCDAAGGYVRSESVAGWGFPHAPVARRLIERLPPGVVRYGAEARGVERAPDGRVRAVVFADGSSVEADLFVAADGNRSVLRQSLFPGATLRPGRVHELVMAIHAPDLVARLGARLVKLVDARRALALGMVPCGEGTVVWFLQMPDDTPGFESLAHADRMAAIRALVDGWAAPAGELIDRTRFEESYLWRTADLDPLPTFAADGVVLVGDAAHPVLPFTSQGVASALTDAVVLGDALDAHGDDLAPALAAYSAARLPEIGALVAAGRALRDTFLARRGEPAGVHVPLAPLAHPPTDP
jgi:2-polyprenyl-6-methoxyphenol hydroxylase-like FAD-dependent oxidoreductase